MTADIFVSRLHEYAFEGVIDKLKAVSPADFECNHIIITPDRHTLNLEKKIYASLKCKGSFNIGVLTLKRLCLKISSKKHISSNCAIMLVSKAVSDCLPELNCFKSSAGHYGFYQSMYREICRLKNSCITYGELIKAAESAEGEFKLRLKDVALIYQRFLALTQNKYIDLSSYLHEITESAGKSALVKNSHFYFLGFDEAAGAEIKTLAAIAKNALYSSFAVCEEGGLFEGLTAELDNQNILYNKLFIEGGKSGIAGFIYRSIESGGKWNGENPKIKLFSLGNIMEETENAAQQIIKLVREEGFRFKDIFVTLPNADDYIYSLDKVFKRYSVPYYLAESAELLSEPLFKALRELLFAADNNCGAENVLAFVKSAYFGEEKENAAVFENYCLKYGIDRSRFLQPFTLCDEDDDLMAAERVRQKFARFYGMAAKSGNLKDFTASARKILQNFALPQSEELRQYGYIDEAAYREQAVKKLNKLLDEIDEFAPFQKVSPKLFIQMLSAGAQSQKLATIPLSADAVVCGGVESAKYSYPKALFILGAAEGKFPAVSYSPMILGDLKNHPALTLSDGDLAGQLKSLRLKIKRLFCGGDKIFISYHTSGGEGKDLFPSDYFINIQKMFDLPVQNRLDFALDVEPEPHNFECDCLSAAADLYFKSGKTSVSAIETYFSCPRKFLFRYGYYALPRKEAGLKSADKGTFLHEVAELFMRKYQKNCNVTALANECHIEVLSRAKYQRFIASEKAVFERLKEEIYRVCGALAAIADKSLFQAKYFEAEFNDGGDFPLIEIGAGKPIFLRGKIDRIDVYERGGKQYARIIDYKSGDLSYAEKDLYFGNKLQLFIYSKALISCGFIPSGAYYFPIHDKFLAEDETPYKLRGVTVNEEEILRASDFNIFDSGSSDILAASFKRQDDGFKENSNLISRQKLESFIEYAANAAAGAVNEILNGFCAITPKKGACLWCDYADVCSLNMPHAVERENNLRGAGEIITEAANG